MSAMKIGHSQIDHYERRIQEAWNQEFESEKLVLQVTFSMLLQIMTSFMTGMQHAEKITRYWKNCSWTETSASILRFSSALLQKHDSVRRTYMGYGSYEPNRKKQLYVSSDWKCLETSYRGSGGSKKSHQDRSSGGSTHFTSKGVVLTYYVKFTILQQTAWQRAETRRGHGRLDRVSLKSVKHALVRALP